eukprot:m.355404 g.355404  ORF g.355404 m.355404 type:complete len:262 (+) comp17246_c0_seq1:155-940(+)
MSTWWQDARTILVLFLAGTVSLYAISVVLLGPMTEEQRADLTLPYTLDRAQRLGSALVSFKEQHVIRTLVLHALVCLYLQAYAIPGTGVANILGGALFGGVLGYILCIVYTVIGSTILYYISELFGRRIANRLLGKRLTDFRQWLHDNSDHLLVHTISTRMFPFCPNWFINVASGQLRIPLRVFVPGVAAGLTPYTFIGVQAGTILSELNSLNDAMKPHITWSLVAVALIGFLAPYLLKRWEKSMSTCLPEKPQDPATRSL